MSSQQRPPIEPTLRVTRSENYREEYASSVQVRMSVWDFLLVFGRLTQDSAEQIDIHNLQAIYISPQQAKALWNVLGHNLQQYEQTFGALSLEPVGAGVGQGGPVH